MGRKCSFVVLGFNHNQSVATDSVQGWKHRDFGKELNLRVHVRYEIWISFDHSFSSLVVDAKT